MLAPAFDTSHSRFAGTFSLASTGAQAVEAGKSTAPNAASSADKG